MLARGRGGHKRPCRVCYLGGAPAAAAGVPVGRGTGMNWSLLLMALGLALILEGLPYFLVPERALRVVRWMHQLGPEALRTVGLLAMLSGVILLLLGRWLG